MKSYSLDYIDDLYVQYVRDPTSVSENWRKYFEQFLVVSGGTSKSKPSTSKDGNGRSQATNDEATAQALWLSRIQDRVNNLVREYRVRGHLVANLDPLGFDRPDSPELTSTALIRRI
jgi:2-oxoglutarate dehydrogenase E1 component